MMERFIAPLKEVKMAPDDSSNLGEFEGYASVWGSVDLGGDMIERGAYKNTLDEWANKGQLPQLLYYHQDQIIIGDWLEMREDDKGLYVKGRLWVKGDLKIEAAVMAYNILKGTSVKGLSIGYSVRDYDSQEQVDGSRIRLLKEINLFEVSIAPYSMEPKAKVHSVKSLTDENGIILTKREVEKVLRDAKLSTRQAKAFISGGYDALVRDEQSVVEVENRDDSSSMLGVLASLKSLNLKLEA
jgi:HK97 family phage prohead protease